jgi:peroxiredoxin Q/BCP
VSDVRLEPGDQAPDFTLTDADGGQVSLSALRGQRVIIYFYPAAMTPGCTKQACDFRDSKKDLSDAGFAVLGISPDSPAKLAKFRDRDGLTFPLLSDPDKAVLKAYGAYGEKMLYGKKSVGVIRSTFVIDADGAIERILRCRHRAVAGTQGTPRRAGRFGGCDPSAKMITPPTTAARFRILPVGSTHRPHHRPTGPRKNDLVIGLPPRG